MAANKICSIPNCSKPTKGRGWCAAHYHRWERHGDPLGGAPDKMRGVTKCAVEGCESRPKYFRRGFCDNHYERNKHHGDPLGGGTGMGVALEFIDKAQKYSASDCLIWPFARQKFGYAIANVRSEKSRLVHRIICERVHGKPPAKTSEARHLCGNGHLACVNPNHLAWGSPQDNANDRILHGRVPRGQKHGNAKLTQEDVKKIREFRCVYSQTEIAGMFNISRQTVHDVTVGRSWSWLK